MFYTTYMSFIQVHRANHFRHFLNIFFVSLHDIQYCLLLAKDLRLNVCIFLKTVMTVTIAAVFAIGFCIFEVFVLPQKYGFEAASGYITFMSNYIKIPLSGFYWDLRMEWQTRPLAYALFMFFMQGTYNTQITYNSVYNVYIFYEASFCLLKDIKKIV
jgi:hypothetical protein